MTIENAGDLRVALLGGSGVVGRTFLSLFEERDLAWDHLYLLASSRSAGSRLEHRGRAYLVEDVEGFDFGRVDLVFCSAGAAVSRRWCPEIARRGVLTIDNTSAFRMDPDVPLVVPQVNGHLLGVRPRRGIIANPNCTTIPMTRVLSPIDKQYRINKVIVSTYQAASGGGLAGIEELKSGTRQLLDDSSARPHAERFDAPLAFNLVPSIDAMLDSGFTFEEQKIAQESQKILTRPDLKLSATSVRVPVVNCHSEAVYFECDSQLRQESLISMLRDTEGLAVYADSEKRSYPTPCDVSGSNDVHVGRIRVDTNNDHAAWVWIVSDNLRVGAALNAVQIAELMMSVQALAHVS